MKVEVVCFDIDGTLYPKWVTHCKLIPSIFPSPLLALRYQKFRRYIRTETEEKTIPENETGFRLRQAAWLSKQPPHSEATQRMERRIERQFYATWNRSFATLRPFPLVRQTIMQFKTMGLTIAVLSDFPVENKLIALGIEDLVDFACCAEESGYLKPHSAPFLFVSKALNTPLNKILYVGDSCAKDIVGASQVGMRTCLLAPQAQSALRRARLQRSCPEATFICSDYEEIQEHVTKMLQ